VEHYKFLYDMYLDELLNQMNWHCMLYDVQIQFGMNQLDFHPEKRIEKNIFKKEKKLFLQ